MVIDLLTSWLRWDEVLGTEPSLSHCQNMRVLKEVEFTCPSAVLVELIDGWV